MRLITEQITSLGRRIEEIENRLVLAELLSREADDDGNEVIVQDGNVRFGFMLRRITALEEKVNPYSCADKVREAKIEVLEELIMHCEMRAETEKVNPVTLDELLRLLNRWRDAYLSALKGGTDE